MKKNTESSKREMELQSDSAINPGFETFTGKNEPQEYFMDGSMGNSVVDFDESDTNVENIPEDQIMHYTKQEKRS